MARLGAASSNSSNPYTHTILLVSFPPTFTLLQSSMLPVWSKEKGREGKGREGKARQGKARDTSNIIGSLTMGAFLTDQIAMISVFVRSTLSKTLVSAFFTIF